MQDTIKTDEPAPSDSDLANGIRKAIADSETPADSETKEADHKEEPTDDESKGEPTKEDILDGVTYEDGNYTVEIAVDGTDRKNVFKAATQKELVQKVMKAFGDSQKHIANLEKERKDGKKDRVIKEAVKQDVDFPTKEEVEKKVVSQVLNSALKDGLKREMFSWTDSDWDNYQSDNSMSQYTVNKMRSSVENYEKQYTTTLNTELEKIETASANIQLANEEFDELYEQIVESGLDPNDFDFTAIAEEVEKDQSSYVGKTLKAGRISRVGNRMIAKFVAEKGKSAESQSEMKKRLDKEREEAEKKRNARPSAGGLGGDSTTKKFTPAKDADELSERMYKLARSS
jgi:hypothetical protein